MVKAAASPELNAAFEKHLKETEGEIGRLEQAFAELGEKAKKKTCEAIKGLLTEGEETIKVSSGASNTASYGRLKASQVGIGVSE